MIQIGIADINKTPSIMDKLDDVAQIVNKKTKEIKGFYIPQKYQSIIQEAIEKIEYQLFLERNQSLITEDTKDDTLLDGLDELY